MDMEKPMSDKRLQSLVKNLKPTIWSLQCSEYEGEQEAEVVYETGFCLDSKRRLLITAAHVVAKKPGKILGRRDLDEAGKRFPCRIICVWANFDLAILQLEEDASVPDLASVTFGSCVNLKPGMPLVSIGTLRRSGFHVITGYLSCQFHDDGESSRYVKMSKDESYIGDESVRFRMHNIYPGHVARPPPMRVRGDDLAHPELKFWQMDFASISDITGGYGSPTFNSKGEVVSIMQFGRNNCLFGVSSLAMETMLRTVQHEN